MKTDNRSIFRASAVQRYLQAREQAVLPRLIAPRTFLYLWILLGLLGVGLAALWATRLPVYVDGLAVVVDGRDHQLPTGDAVAVALLLPSEQRSKLQAGQPLFMRFQRLEDPIEQSIIAVESEISSPEVVSRRFALANAGPIVNKPMLVAVSRFEPPGSIPASLYLGSVGEAHVLVGSRRAITLVPLIGDLFGEERP